MSASLNIDVPATLSALEQGMYKVSWSKWKVLQECPASWLATNYAVWLHPRTSSVDDKASIPGTSIQKLFEVFFNEQIYKECPTEKHAVQWFAHNFPLLVELISRPYKDQFNFAPGESRKYFRTKQGISDLQKAHKNGLDSRIKYGLKLSFYNKSDIELKFGSYDNFIANLIYAAEISLHQMYEMKLDFSTVLSEHFVSATLGPYEILGGVDFIINPLGAGHPGRRGSKVKQDFIIVDGKWTLGDTLSWEQNRFYGAALQLQLRATPKFLGFLCWTEGRFEWDSVPFSSEYVFDLRRRLDKAFSKLRPVIKSLTQLSATSLTRSEVSPKNPSVLDLLPSPDIAPIEKKRVSLLDVEHLNFSPSRPTCRYCSIVHSCPEAAKKGYAPKKPETENPISNISI